MKILLASVVVLATAFGTSVQDPYEQPKPGPQHALLHKHVGAWDAVAIMAGPDGAEMRSKATMTTTKSGEFHTVDSYRGDFMGMAFEGHGINSYCPVRKKFIATWTDSMSPSPLQLVGGYDEKTKKLTMTGEMAGMSGKMEPCRAVTIFQDDDHYAFELHGVGPDGAEAKMVRIEYTRKK